MLALVENRAILEKEADESSADARLLALENETAALRHARSCTASASGRTRQITALVAEQDMNLATLSLHLVGQHQGDTLGHGAGGIDNDGKRLAIGLGETGSKGKCGGENSLFHGGISWLDVVESTPPCSGKLFIR